MLLDQTAVGTEKRKKEDTASVFDQFRSTDLTAALGANSKVLSTEMVKLLWELTAVCAKDSLTSLTAGVLQDILDFIAMASGVDPMSALDRQVAQKLVPQLSGPVTIAKAVREVLTSQPEGEAKFPYALRTLDALIETADPSSGLVFFKY